MRKILLAVSLFCCIFILFTCSKDGGGSKKSAYSGYTVSIEPGQPVVLYYGETHNFKASVKDKNGVAVDDALIKWSVDSTTDSAVCSFSVAQTSPTVETVLTAGNCYFKGKVIADYNGVKASVNLEIKDMTYVVTIDTPTAQSLTIYKGETQNFKAYVKNARNVVVSDNVLISWKTEGTNAGVFSLQKTTPGQETVFTPGASDYDGKITAEYKGATASVNVKIKDMTYVVTISSPVAQPVFVYKGKTQQFTALVKNARNVVVPGAIVNWKTEGSGAGSFSAQQLSTVFTAGQSNFRGKVVVEYKGATASIDLIVGENDQITVTGTSQYAIIGGAETLSFTAIVKANGHTVSPQPAVNWGSSKGSIGSLSPATGQTVNLVPKGEGTITVTASLAANSAVKGTAGVTVKSKYTVVLNDAFSIKYYGDVDVTRSGSEIKIVLASGGCAAFKYSAGATQDLRGYTKMSMTLRCSEAGANLVYLGMYYGNKAAYKSLTATNAVYDVSIKNIDLSNVSEYFYIENPSSIGTKTVYLSKIEYS